MKVKWNVDNVLIYECSPRTRTDPKTKTEHTYVVLKFGKEKGERHTCLVFSPSLMEEVGEGLSCSLRGEVSFGQGSTYLVAKKLNDGDTVKRKTAGR